jgi:hypothetical protein
MSRTCPRTRPMSLAEHVAWHVVCHDIIVDFGVDTQSTATFCCAWHVICCQCKKCVSNMSIVIDIDLWADMKWCQCKNVSDASQRVTCVGGVCQLWGDLLTGRKTTCSAKPMSPHFQGHGVVPGQCGLRLVLSCVWRTCPHIWVMSGWDYRLAPAPSTKRSTIGPKRSTIFDDGLYVLFLRKNRRILIASELSHHVTICSKQTYRAWWGYHLSHCNYQTMLVDSSVSRPQVFKVTTGNRSSIMVPTCIQTSVMLI